MVTLLKLRTRGCRIKMSVVVISQKIYECFEQNRQKGRMRIRAVQSDISPTGSLSAGMMTDCSCMIFQCYIGVFIFLFELD
jgi:hypothetical protein